MGFLNVFKAFCKKMKTLSLITCYISKITLKISAIFAFTIAALSFSSCGVKRIIL